MYFLIVGHTHEDIDAFFSKVSKRIHGSEIATFPSLMVEVWECESIHPISRLIIEVASYKSFVLPFIKHIVGHSSLIAFRFSMINNIPVYQVKENIQDPWTPYQGRSIWKVDENNNIMLPNGIPFAKPMNSDFKKIGEITTYIEEYLKFLLKTSTDPGSSSYIADQDLYAYWNKILLILKNKILISQSDTILLSESGDFWPKTNHGTGYVSSIGLMVHAENINSTNLLRDLQQELEEEMIERDVIFVGAYKDKERFHFVPLEDIMEGKFVVVRPTDEFEKLLPKVIWMCKALGSIQTDESQPNCGEFPMEWWRPKHRKATPTYKERYEKSLLASREWEIDPEYNTQQWLNGDSAIYSWSSRIRNQMPTKRMRIPQTVRDVITEYFARIREMNLTEIN